VLTKAVIQRLIPEIIVAKEALVLSSLDGDIDGSRSGHLLQEISNADGLLDLR